VNINDLRFRTLGDGVASLANKYFSLLAEINVILLDLGVT
jgi:hypothetical protein